MLKVFLAEDPTGLRTAEWLKTHPPEGVTALSVEALVLKARRLQGLVDKSAFPPRSIFSKLSESAQSELLHRLQGLDTVLRSVDHTAQRTLFDAGDSAARDSIKAIHHSVTAVCKAVETPLLLDPYFTNHAELQQTGDEAAKVTGAEDAISLRRQLLNISAIPDHLEIPRDLLYLSMRAWVFQSSARFRRGTLKDKDVLVESFPHQDQDGNNDAVAVPPSQEEIEQVERMTALLCQPKNASFHILPCVGYINEPLRQRFSFVFEKPRGNDANAEPVSLRELYKLARIVPLGHRIRLAYELIVALENSHRVGWVHKNISSSNIMFLMHSPHSLRIADSVRIDKLEDSTKIGPFILDLASPWLFGFDASRPEDGHSHLREDHSLGNNIYRHPDRWGKPSVSFIKTHDVYSLGIVLLEIAFWKDILSLAEISRPEISYESHRLIPSRIRAQLVAKYGRYLPHQAGQIFTDTILACLDFERNTRELNAYDQHRYYETHVADGITKAIDRI